MMTLQSFVFISVLTHSLGFQIISQKSFISQTPYQRFGTRNNNLNNDSLIQVLQKRSQSSLLYSSTNSNNEEGMNDDADEPIFYNDFEDFEFGSSSTSSSTKNDDDIMSSPTLSSMSYSAPSETSLSSSLQSQELSSLSSLLTQSKQRELEKEDRIERNWSTGNWKVRGFSLAQYSNQNDFNSSNSNNDIDNDTQSIEEESAIKICQIAFDETMIGFNDVTETIAVGRTDGSVYIIQLGSDYMTNFAPSPTSSSSDNEMVMMQQQESNDEEGNDDANGMSTSSPFQILHQFYANDQKQPIESLLYHDELLYTSSGSSGEINVWSIDDEDMTINNNDASNTMKSMVPIQTLKNGHDDKVVVMKTLSTKKVDASGNGSSDSNGVNDHNLLLTASLDGSFALWSREDGDLVYRCEMTDDFGNPVSITCADIDTSADEHFVYLGLSSGHVVGYAISDLVGSASEGNECPIPSCRFMAHDPTQQKSENKDGSSSSSSSMSEKGVTAIACVGMATATTSQSRMENESQQQRSALILTGGADGMIKQYQMLRREISTPTTTAGKTQEDNKTPSWKLEHWPRLPTQRMKDHAHVFQGHYDSVTALSSLSSGSKIISASIDGTLRIWDQTKGAELYRMDGFDNKISSLCLDREVLVTNGMNGYVCVHDFDVSDVDVDEGFDLDLEW